jgi:hypothetical protein
VSNQEWAVSTLMKLHVCDSLLPLLMYVLGPFYVFHCKILILFALGLTVARILRASGSSEVMEISSSIETPDVVRCLMRYRQKSVMSSRNDMASRLDDGDVATVYLVSGDRR